MKLLFRNNYGDIHPWKAAFWIIVALVIIPLGLAVNNILWIEGVPVTMQGQVQLHELRHDKFWNYDWTFIEVQTFSGDTHHYHFLGHIDLDFGEVYRITYTRTSLLGHHINMYNKVLEVEWLGEG